MGGIISIIAITLLSLGVMLIYYKNKQVDVIKGIIPLLFATLGFGIVGVPFLFKCDFGPSALSCWLTFNFLNIGKIIIPNNNATPNATNNIFI